MDSDGSPYAAWPWSLTSRGQSVSVARGQLRVDRLTAHGACAPVELADVLSGLPHLRERLSKHDERYRDRGADMEQRHLPPREPAMQGAVVYSDKRRELGTVWSAFTWNPAASLRPAVTTAAAGMLAGSTMSFETPPNPLTKVRAEELAAEALRTLPWRDGLVVTPAYTIEHAVGWAVFYGRPDKQMLIGAGPFIITRDGEVFATGSAHPASAYLEDACVMTGQTRNPVRIVRYLWRRFSDGRTPKRMPHQPTR